MGDLRFMDLRVANIRRAVEWNGGSPTSLEFCMIELAGEVGEAMNALKKMLRQQRGMAGGISDARALIDELADVVICADLAAQRMGVDLGAAVEAKFNATSKKHGFQTLRHYLNHPPCPSVPSMVNPDPAPGAGVGEEAGACSTATP